MSFRIGKRVGNTYVSTNGKNVRMTTKVGNHTHVSRGFGLWFGSLLPFVVFCLIIYGVYIVDKVGMECISFVVFFTIGLIIAIILLVKLLFVIDHIIETNQEAKENGVINQMTQQKLFDECFNYYKNSGYDDDEAWELAIEDLKNNKIL